ncbi:protease inhibitor I42 family protein [Chloroflexota bacterium]
MKSRTILIIATLATLLSLASCIVTSQALGVEIACDRFTEDPHSIRNDFQMEVNDKLTVKLCANPTTGFEWTYETSGDTVLKEEDHDSEEPEKEGVMGASGTEVWTFEAFEKGTTEVIMEYGQQWEGGEKGVWTYTITVTVE